MKPEFSLPQYLQEKGEELNRLARDVDSALFFFCNYEDVQLPIFTAYDYFVQSIQELYKFTIDCCPINAMLLNPDLNKSYYNHICEIDKPVREEYKQICRDIKVLRAVYDHNNSAKNSGNQKKNLIEFRNVFVRIAGFEHDAAGLKSESFELANQNLQDYAKKVVCFVRKFAQCIENLPVDEKQAVVHDLKERILNWYSNNTKQDYFLGYIDQRVSFTAFKNYVVRRGRKRLGDHIAEIVRKNELCASNLETDAKNEALHAFKAFYESNLELPQELEANTPEEAKKRLEAVNGQLNRVIEKLPPKDYGGIFLSQDCQTALFEATRQLYPTCSLLPQEFYDYVVFKLLALR